ncbi:hypothetical protein U1Q18_011523, partial [Sarracenia purpurea var. burkii]
SPHPGKSLKNGVGDPVKVAAIHRNPACLAAGIISAQFSAEKATGSTKSENRTRSGREL